MGENNSQWKGDKVSYSALHDYIAWHLPKTELCQCCNKVPPYDLANISQKYKRDLSDWEWLCRKCHMEKDGRLFSITHQKIKKYCKNGHKFTENNTYFYGKKKQWRRCRKLRHVTKWMLSLSIHTLNTIRILKMQNTSLPKCIQPFLFAESSGVFVLFLRTAKVSSETNQHT